MILYSHLIYQFVIQVWLMSLLYADAIILLSDSEEGILKSLDGLNIFLHQLEIGC